ncbi:putative deoxyribose-phosphate aldolase [Neospora caninum Liverpool]|uniref:Deoxyribose-phosphate aldolase, putative n=1 Tax=Neospora caninum (strain Liverpool) TaxID=572307 RepID=F0VAC4_NEOCL|nr:putative deoxyribose-phosphate aldolase [Neospora caninum Liverpool]CBZ50613.1 putative deoxyribose-phosphate aldolase [Neospora caninum Liverpool]CEL65225.1 TPA: deoxyribose-phosphate aldolase, putative [Neospora caninum Liverpool]|eukprot:XP_003880646.1 putative deoxyribose-phosphate aldolase [Neospora caninum Liverpool]
MATNKIYKQFTSRTLLNFFEVSALADSETNESIASVCKAAAKDPAIVGICVRPSFVKFIKQQVVKSAPEVANIKVCAAVNFPDGTGTPDTVSVEAVAALKDGADEIECLIDWRQMNEDVADGESRVRLLVSEVKKVVAPKTLKAVLGAGELQGGDIISRAAVAALEGGADFLQTSSGLGATHATMFMVHLISIALRDYMVRERERVNVERGMREGAAEGAAVRRVGIMIEVGDVHTAETADFLMQMIFENGPGSIIRERFRVGGSFNLLKELRECYESWDSVGVSPDTAP